MPGTFRVYPNEARRQRHSIRGLVVAHATKVTGWWLWKKSTPTVEVRFPEAEYNRYGRIIRETNPLEPYPRNRVEVGFATIAERDEYRVGEIVDVQFSTAGPMEEFFTGAETFRWDGLRKAYAAAG